MKFGIYNNKKYKIATILGLLTKLVCSIFGEKMAVCLIAQYFLDKKPVMSDLHPDSHGRYADPVKAYMYDARLLEIKKIIFFPYPPPFRPPPCPSSHPPCLHLPPCCLPSPCRPSPCCPSTCPSSPCRHAICAMQSKGISITCYSALDLSKDGHAFLNSCSFMPAFPPF